MEELHDIVDRNDRVVGQATFAEARERNLIIRVVHNWILNSHGKLLFQFRAAHKKSNPRSFDASVGGKLAAGETYDDAVLRETQEELGISASPEHIGDFFVDVPSERKFVRVYLSRHDGPFQGWEQEAIALEWMSPAEALGLMHRFPYLFCGTDSLDIVCSFLERQQQQIRC